MSNTTTVRTSSTHAFEAWRKARRAVELAGRLYADQHTAATKLHLRAAQKREELALQNYTQSRMAKYSEILSGKAGGS